MKILHVLAQLPSKTGSGVYYSNLIDELDTSNDNYAIFGYQDSCEFDFTTIEKSKQYPVHFENDILNFNIVGMSDIMPYNSTKYKDMDKDMIKRWISSFTDAILKAYEEVKPDMIICHHLWMLTSLTLDLLGDKCNRIIGICHGTDIRQALQNPELKNEYVKDLNRLYKVFALSVDQINPISDTFKIAKEKIIVTAGGYNQKIFYRDSNAKNDDNEFINIVYAGKISNAKGVYELIKAYKKLNYKDNIILNIIGSAQGDNVERIKKELEDTSNIKLFNAKNQESLAELFRYSDIFILPSYYEGLGLVAIEALASGMFVVSTEIIALMELLGDKVNNSNIIEYVKLPRLKNVDTPIDEDIPKFVENLANAIDKQVERVKDKDIISEDIYDLIAANSWENIAKKIFMEITK